MGDGPDSDRFFDFGAVYEGPIVECLNRIFVSDWAFASKQKLEDINGIMEPTTDPAGHSTVMGIASGPDVEGDILYERLINAIQEFEDDIVIVTPYFVPDEVLLRSLVVKAHFGQFRTHFGQFQPHFDQFQPRFGQFRYSEPICEFRNRDDSQVT